MLSPGVMNYLIQQSMLSNTTSEQIIDGIWSTFVPPHARRAGGLKHYFAQTLALMRPSHASRVLGNFRRLASFYAELKIPRKIRCHVEFFIRRHDRQTYHPEWSGAPLLDLPVVPGARVC